MCSFMFYANNGGVHTDFGGLCGKPKRESIIDIANYSIDWSKEESTLTDYVWCTIKAYSCYS